MTDDEAWGPTGPGGPLEGLLPAGPIRHPPSSIRHPSSPALCPGDLACRTHAGYRGSRPSVPRSATSIPRGAAPPGDPMTTSPHRHPFGIVRREFLQVGFSGFLGMGLPGLLA